MSKVSKWANRVLGIPEIRLVNRKGIEDKIDAAKPGWFALCRKNGIPESVALVLWVALKDLALDALD